VQQFQIGPKKLGLKSLELNPRIGWSLGQMNIKVKGWFSHHLFLENNTIGHISDHYQLGKAK